jgi:dGTP triphosphohydrolase
MWKDDATAADILLAARSVQDFVAGMSQQQFLDESHRGGGE